MVFFCQNSYATPPTFPMRFVMSLNKPVNSFQEILESLRANKDEIIKKLTDLLENGQGEHSYDLSSGIPYIAKDDPWRKTLFDKEKSVGDLDWLFDYAYVEKAKYQNMGTISVPGKKIFRVSVPLVVKGSWCFLVDGKILVGTKRSIDDSRQKVKMNENGTDIVLNPTLINEDISAFYFSFFVNEKGDVYF